jgi:Protein of unknown function (DUF2631)
VVAGTGQDLAKSNGRATATVDPADEPSAAWGWHGGFPRGTVIAGWFSAVLLLLMTIGNHEGHIEDIYLVGIALGTAYGLVRHSRQQKNSWRR